MNKLRNFIANILILLVFITVPVTALEAAVDPDLVGMWHMDGDWLDSSGNGNNGTPYNGMMFSTDKKIGTNSGIFNGTASYVSVNNSPSLNVVNSMSIELWVKSNINWDEHINWVYLVHKRIENYTGYGIYIDSNTPRIVFSIINAGGVTYSVPSYNLLPNTWYHIVGTFDGSNIKIYVNGQLLNSAQASGVISTNTSNLEIGRWRGAYQEYFNGLLDEVAIYKRALSAEEIQEHYRTQVVNPPVVNPVTSPTATATITLSGTKPANTAIIVNGNTLVPLDGATTWQANYTLSQGTNNLTITTQDSQNFNSLPVTLTIILDTTPPGAPTIDPVPAPINSTSKNITGTRSIDSSSIVVSYAGATFDTIFYPTATTWSAYISGLKEGNNTISAYAVDEVGNLSSTATATVTIDTTPPSVGVTPAGGIFNSSQTVELTASEPVVIYYTLDGSTPTASATIYNQPISMPSSATLKYFGRDLAGNDSKINAENYVIDTTPPVLSISTLSNGTYTNNETLNIAGTVTDDTDVKGITVNGAAVQLNQDGSFSYALLLKNGANIITVTVTDSAGNVAMDERTVTLDQTAPILAVTAPADNSKTGNVLLEVGGTVDETSTVTVKMKDTVQNAIMDGGAFTSTLTLESGYNTIEITATDLAGNQSSLKRTVLYDDQKPSLAIIEPNQDIRTNLSSLTIKGTASDTLTSVGVTINKDNEVFIPPVIDGKFEQEVSFSEEKTYNIVVTATNEVGTSASVQRNVIYDITPPALSIDPVHSPTCLSSQSIRGTREAGATVTVSCATATVGGISYPTATTWQADISGLMAGKNIITAESVDAAGNAVAASATIILTSKLPEITITVTPNVIWPPNHRLVPVKITGGVKSNGCAIKSVLISVRDEYGKIKYKNLEFGKIVMLEAWRKANDRDGRKYTISVVVTTKGGITTSKMATVTVPHEYPHIPRKQCNGFEKDSVSELRIR